MINNDEVLLLLRNSDFPNVAIALWEWLCQAIPFIQSQDGYGSTEADYFEKQDGDTFIRHSCTRKVYKPHILHAALTLPSLRNVHKALIDERVLRPLVGKYLSAEANYFRFDAQMIAQIILPNDLPGLERNDLSTPVAGKIVNILSTLARVLKDEAIEAKHVTPLWRLEIDGPVQLEHGLVIDELTDDEVERALRMQAIIPDIGSSIAYHRSVGANLCLRRSTVLPLSVISRPPTPDESLEMMPMLLSRRGFEDLDHLLVLLSLTTSGFVEAGATMQHSSARPLFGVEGATYGSANSPVLFDRRDGRGRARLQKTDATELQGLWKAYRDDPVDGTFGIALRRLRLAAEKQRVDDRLLDLMIAAEAIFIPRGDDHGELRFRSSLNASLYLESDLEARRAIFDLMRAAYDMRSSLVHGDEPKTQKINKVEHDVAAMIPKVEDVVRRALKKRLTTTDFDWSNIMFPQAT